MPVKAYVRSITASVIRPVAELAIIFLRIPGFLIIAIAVPHKRATAAIIKYVSIVYLRAG